MATPPQATPDAASRAPSVSPRATIRVLIVEDQEVLRELLLTVFNRAGFESVCAATVAEAMAKLDPPPHFITLDLHLPDGRGTEILQRVREERLPIRVALTTGALDPALLASAVRLKPDRVFQKPYSAVEIAEWIRACSQG